MIIVELQGGLGNQMFQYACGKVLSLKYKQKLLIDYSFLEQNQFETDEFTPRSYELDVFQLNVQSAEKELVHSFKSNSPYKKIQKFERNIKQNPTCPNWYIVAKMNH